MFKQYLAGAAALALAFPALAAGDAAAGLQAMKQRNLIVFGDMSAAHDVEGKTFVGGELTGFGIYGIGNSSQRQGDATGLPTLTVVGNASGGNLNNGRDGATGNAVGTPAGVVVGGNLGTLNMNPHHAVVKVGGKASSVNGSTGSTIQTGGAFSGNANGSAIDSNLGAVFTNALQAELLAEKGALISDLKALSSALYGMADTAGSGFNFSDHNNVKLKAIAGTDGYAVVNVDAANFFRAISGLTYDFATGLTTVVNVHGAGDYNWNFNTLSGGGYNSSVLFNFGEANGLKTNRMVHGSILAPFAYVTNSTPIEGTLVAASFGQGGEIHLGNFGGSIPFQTPPGGVPEPATWAMLIAGFGMVGMIARRRRVIAA